MANENIKKFEELLRSDEDVQAKVRAAGSAYEGDKTDERAVFEALIAPVAAELGLPFTYEEGRAYARALKPLDDDEVSAVAGGGICYIIGGEDEVDSGQCLDNGVFESGFGACAYVGGGFLSW